MLICTKWIALDVWRVLSGRHFDVNAPKIFSLYVHILSHGRHVTDVRLNKTSTVNSLLV